MSLSLGTVDTNLRGYVTSSIVSPNRLKNNVNLLALERHLRIRLRSA